MKYVKVKNKNLKYCFACKQIKTKTEFYKDRYKGDGLNTKCKSCSQLWWKNYYYTHSEFRKKRVLYNRKRLESLNEK